MLVQPPGLVYARCEKDAYTIFHSKVLNKRFSIVLQDTDQKTCVLCAHSNTATGLKRHVFSNSENVVSCDTAQLFRIHFVLYIRERSTPKLYSGAHYKLMIHFQASTCTFTTYTYLPQDSAHKFPKNLIFICIFFRLIFITRQKYHWDCEYCTLPFRVQWRMAKWLSLSATMIEKTKHCMPSNGIRALGNSFDTHRRKYQPLKYFHFPVCASM